MGIVTWASLRCEVLAQGFIGFTWCRSEGLDTLISFGLKTLKDTVFMMSCCC